MTDTPKGWWNEPEGIEPEIPAVCGRCGEEDIQEWHICEDLTWAMSI